MPRIRTIKPEFWGDFQLAEKLTRDQRLFYIGLWNEADDEGRFQAHPARLKGVIFPYDSDIHGGFIEDSLRALAEMEKVVLYRVKGEPYGQLTNFLSHQKINRPTPSRILPPDNELSEIIEDSVSDHGRITDGSQGERKGKEGERKRKGKERGKEKSADLENGNGSLSPNELVAFWIDQQSSKPAQAQIRKQGAAAKRICGEYSRSEIVQAAVGISQLFPHSDGEPWDLFDLERKFAKAMEGANNHPDARIARDIQHTMTILGGPSDA